MQNRVYDALPAEHGLHNVRFLMQQQVRHLEALARAGRETSDALDLLRRLMDMETALRAQSAAAPPAAHLARA